MNIPISQEESQAISIVRILAMFSIVVCHFCQAYNNPLAWRFNVGVQVFLALSGYLYGHKNIEKWGLWFWQRFKKLYIPCFLYVLVVLTILHYKVGTDVSLYRYVSISAVDGINHLWFMKAILLCYLITPLLSYLRRWPLMLVLLLFLLGVLEFGFIQFKYDIFSWVWLYSLGYVFPLLKCSYKRIFALIIFISAISFSVMLIFTDLRIFTDLWHYTWGLSICLLGIWALKHIIVKIKIPNILYKIVPYSFHIYITHHLFLIGPLSIIPFMPNIVVGIICVLLLTSASSFILKAVSDKIISII